MVIPVIVIKRYWLHLKNMAEFFIKLAVAPLITISLSLSLSLFLSLFFVICSLSLLCYPSISVSVLFLFYEFFITFLQEFLPSQDLSVLNNNIQIFVQSIHNIQTYYKQLCTYEKWSLYIELHIKGKKYKTNVIKNSSRQRNFVVDSIRHQSFKPSKPLIKSKLLL